MRRVAPSLPTSGLHKALPPQPPSGLQPDEDHYNPATENAPVGEQLASLESSLEKLEFSLLNTAAKLHGAGPSTEGKAIDKMDGMFASLERLWATVRRVHVAADQINQAI